MNMKKEFNKQEGFTLIELMIVVAIIGILAAIAIPQFAAYRTKAFNSAAESDLHTARLAEESLFTDYQKYGGSVAASGTAGATAGALLTTDGFVATTTAGQEAPVALSNNVKLVANMDGTSSYATVTAKHDSGDKLYAVETDQSGTYFKVSAAGTALTTGTSVAATSGADCTTAGYTAM
ncbi:MAG TPA: type II secretion system protein [Mariprofundaceae bacterium]|nr:type II secretion system protein [Mariprofundaceae bacterium]